MMISIVIGSGFGGIAAALRLKAKGHEVTLIEKHQDLGGRARVFKRNGFTFDGGPTVITAPYLINELFELFQKDPKDYIKLSPLKIWYQFIFDDKSKFNYSGNETEMKNQIEKLSKEDVKGYKKWTSVFVVYGSNALFAYCLAELWAGALWTFIKFPNAKGEWVVAYLGVFDSLLKPNFDPYFGSLIFAVFHVVLFWLVLLPLYKRKIFIKI